VNGPGEARFRGLLESAPDAMVCVDASGRITIANAQAERLFGYDREELIGQLVEVLVPDSVRGIHPMYRSGYVAEPRPRPMGAGIELAARRKDGTEFPAEISLSAIETREGLLVSAAIRDVTERIEAQAERERLRLQAERERLERQLHQSQRLESLGQLAGGVAHDFNNLLLVIRNYASFVSEELAAVAEGRPHADWDVIRSDTLQVIAAADRATRLTHQLLAFGRREVVHPEALSLNDVVTDIEKLLRRTLGEHVELRTALAVELWRTMADPGQIEQVLVNLAVNARDAMDDGGTLLLETKNITLTDSEIVAFHPVLTPGRYVELRVTDNGKGMHREVVDRAFEPFFTTKPKGEGAGLGLATVYGIIAQSRGHTAISSEPGYGTTITALLPATDEVATVNETVTVTSPPRGAETVLLVEDEEAVRELTSRILARNGYRVLVADSGPAALEIAEEPANYPIHLLLTDVVMPRMLGKEVAEHAVKLLPDISVVFMSGYALPTLGEQTLHEGVVLVQKPFTEAVLLNTIREVLNARD
jgi:PAS domain S-box-containing protein